MADNADMADAGSILAERHGLILKGAGFYLNGLVHERPVCLFSGCRCENTRIGAFSYLGANCDCRNVEIGRHCSLANDIRVGLGRHPPDWMTAYPFTDPENPFAAMSSHGPLARRADTGEDFDRSPARVTIGNDVWIGAGALFPAAHPVSVGDGAVIAARAVVTKDVPPYSVVAGSPARVTRMRFSDALRAALADTRWWDYDWMACSAEHPDIFERAMLREPVRFLAWWKAEGGRLLAAFPLNPERRLVTQDADGLDIRILPASARM